MTLGRDDANFAKPGSVNNKMYTSDQKSLFKEYASASNRNILNNGNDTGLMHSPSIVSQAGASNTRVESVYGDEMDDGTRGVRHGFGV